MVKSTQLCWWMVGCLSKQCHHVIFVIDADEWEVELWLNFWSHVFLRRGILGRGIHGQRSFFWGIQTSIRLKSWRSMELVLSFASNAVLITHPFAPRHRNPFRAEMFDELSFSPSIVKHMQCFFGFEASPDYKLGLKTDCHWCACCSRFPSHSLSDLLESKNLRIKTLAKMSEASDIFRCFKWCFKKKPRFTSSAKWQSSVSLSWGTDYGDAVWGGLVTLKRRLVCCRRRSGEPDRDPPTQAEIQEIFEESAGLFSAFLEITSLSFVT